VPMTKDEILAEVMKLQPAERDDLAEEIWQRNAPDLTPEQFAELHRRIEAVDRGEMKTYTIDEVMRRLRERFGQ
jgi:putative addiction module component (TIGR02574 family)